MKLPVLHTSFAILAMIFTALPCHSLAQTSTWAQPGAHWFYSTGDNVPIGWFGYYEIWEDGDTLFANGITCDILRTYEEGIIFWSGNTIYSHPGPTLYTYQSNDTVYVHYQGQFHTLFVNNMQPGGQFITGPSHEGVGCAGDTITIDSLMSVNLNGVVMNRIVPEVPDWWSGGWPPGGATIYFHSPIYERFGSTGFFLPYANCVTDIAYGPIRCYSDSSGFTYTTNVTPTCDYFTSVGETPGSAETFSIAPNPATNKIGILLSPSLQSEKLEFEITNMLGEVVRSISPGASTSDLDVRTLQHGRYFIKIKNRPEIKPVSFLRL